MFNFDSDRVTKQEGWSTTSKETEESNEKSSFDISALIKLLDDCETVSGVGINLSKAFEWFDNTVKDEDMCKARKDFVDCLSRLLSRFGEDAKATATSSESANSHETEDLNLIDYWSNFAYVSYKGDAYEVIHIWDCLSERLTNSELVSVMKKFLNRVSNEELTRVFNLLCKRKLYGVEELYFKVVKNKVISDHINLEELKRLRAVAIQELTANFMRDVDGCNKYYDELERKLLK